LLARTDWEAPKHKGITYFVFPMKQAGVEVRPIRQITGESRFNVVFISDATVADSYRLGEVNGGWRVLQHALALERTIMGEKVRAGREREAAVAGGHFAEMDLVTVTRRRGRAGDPVIRDRVARLVAMNLVNKWNGLRAEEDLAPERRSTVASLGKLAMSGILHQTARVQSTVVGAESMLDGSEHSDADTANFLSLNAYHNSIGGGTDQIERNIIGERNLGLPREPDPTSGLPFSEVIKERFPRQT
jgi:alkylation response protein AidB-like acyl-CoA dehydrogenase